MAVAIVGRPRVAEVANPASRERIDAEANEVLANDARFAQEARQRMDRSRPAIPLEQPNDAMTLYFDALNTTQTQVLRQLGPILTKRGFYLAGGTALALQLGHRRSVDFDWFANSGLSDPLQFAEDLRRCGVPFNVSEFADRTLHGRVSRVPVSCFEYRYGLVEEAIEIPEFGVKLASIVDIACMKLAAVAQRGARKDFVDLYWILKEVFSLQQVVEMYCKKYQVDDIAHVLYSLTYFDDADAERSPRLSRPARWSNIKNAFQSWVKAIAK